MTMCLEANNIRCKCLVDLFTSHADRNAEGKSSKCTNPTGSIKHADKQKCSYAGMHRGMHINRHTSRIVANRYSD